MTCGRPHSSVAGLTAAALVAGVAVVLAGTAGAQQLSTPDRPSTGIGPFQTTVRQAPPQQRRRASEPQREVLIDDTPQQQGRIPLPPSDAADPASPDATRDNDDADSGRPVIGRRPVVDGDLNWPPEPVAPRDGVIDTADPDPTSDGVAPGQVDARSPEDLAPFERPPAGFDPDAFAVELDPILDRRPQSLFRFEPFEAVGWRVGSFVVLPETIFAFKATDNLFRSGVSPRSDVALEVRPSIRAVSAWSRHALEFQASANTSFHNDFPKEDDRAYFIESRGRLDVTRRTNVEVLASHELSQESRGSINAARSLDRTDLETTRAGVTLNHRFNRLAVQLRGSVADVDYSSVLSETGAVVTNRERDNRQGEVAARATWSFKPELAVFAEVAENAREYRAASGDGIKRDSTGERYRTGVSFGNTSRKVRGEVSVGYGRQQFEDSRLPEIDGVLIDANLAWRVSGITALLFSARTDVSESQIAGSGGALSRTAALELRHEVTRRLIVSAGMRWTSQDYFGSSVDERELAGLLGLEYYVNREITLFGRYQHIDFHSTQAGRSYDIDEVRLGVRVRR